MAAFPSPGIIVSNVQQDSDGDVYTQGIGYSLAFFAGQYDTAELVVYAVALVEADAILSNHV